jgi:serine/threonine-protein kinase
MPSRFNDSDGAGPPGGLAHPEGAAGRDGGELLHGRYRLTRPLGSGGMAEVFLAEDLRLGRLVAVKMLRPELAADESFVERFRTEARAVAMLNHPNIVALHDRGQAGGRWYLVMEYVPGETLKQRLRREGAFAPDEAVRVARGLLAALQAAHERHIVHRDVTAQNVLLADDGRVKVADFGVARIGVSALTRTGTMIGTCHYLSPEQAQGQRADERSDLYSAGVVLYEMLTGRLPFEGDSDVAIALKHVNEAPPRPRAVAPDVPEALERVVLRALAKDPAARYQSAAEALRALDEATGGTGVVHQASRPAETVNAVVDVRPAAVAAPPEAVAGDAAPPEAVAGDAAPTQAVAGEAAPTEVLAGDEALTRVADAHAAPAGVLPELVAHESRQRKRRRWPLAAALAVLAAAAAAAALYVFVIAAGAVVPDVVGQSEAQARAAIRGAGLRVVTHREYVDGVDAGAVARQRPGAGVAVDDRSRVDIWVSRGPVHVPAPDLRGLRAAEAHDLLVDAGLGPSRRSGRSDDVAAGEVYRQEPKAGETLTRGDTVTYWVSTGLPRVAVPDVIGLSSGEAAAELEAAGLAVNVDVTFGWGEYPDTVVDQDPAAGVKVEPGAEVTISVAVF